MLIRSLSLVTLGVAMGAPLSSLAQERPQVVTISSGPAWVKAPTPAELSAIAPSGAGPSVGRMECTPNADGTLRGCTFLESAGNVEMLTALSRARRLYAISVADAAALNAKGCGSP